MNARFYVPYLNRFLQPDTIIPNPADPQSFNRYSYVFNNPLKYTDPDGHIPLIFAIPLLVAGVAAIADWGTQVHDNMVNTDMSFWAAVHHPNLDEGEIVTTGVAAGATTFTVMAAAPVVVTAVGEGLMGAGLATGSTTLFSAGTSTVSAGGTLAATIYGCDQVLSQPGRGNRATNNANAPRLNAQLTREEAASTFLDDGTLHPETLAGSRPIIPGTELHTSTQNHLTQDGSNIADWAKYSSATSSSPAGSFQVHFYYNSVTRQANYDYDYKAVWNAAHGR